MTYLHDKLRMNWTGHVASMDRRGAYRVLVGKPEGKRPITRHRQRGDNTKINFLFILYNDQQMHTIISQIITATCFDTNVSSSGSL